MSEISFSRSSVSEYLAEIYERMLKALGPQGWWPGDTPFEVCVGAVLTQNTNWTNVEKAIAGLRERDLLEPRAIFELPREMVAAIIRPAGYYNVKASRLRNFTAFLMEKFGGSLDAMFSLAMEELRSMLLEVNGIGPETADSILLYAGGYPSFVVDAYTMRILKRHDLVFEEAGYDEVRSLFMDSLPEDPVLFNEYHALLVALGRNYCRRSRPLCRGCPLDGI
ncbi:MAG TPA: endonuclease III domain-containing protein [Thermodesulfobacteriaceae bacterium]|nr:endonuclease III domain-containing protein [Thermodesulfobacteriaceae bacterium]